MSAYKDSGVDIDAGNALVQRIKADVKSTHNNNVVDNYGSFAAMYRLPTGLVDPILVACNDGVGTKLALAKEYGFHDTVGQDLVAMCVNDLYCAGATPLYFLDYLATGKLDVDEAALVISGIAKACETASCALIGGETAEMPGMYSNGDYDLAGFCTGVVEAAHVYDINNIQAGDCLIGLPSVGPHSNGYSLIRKLLAERPDILLPYLPELIAPTKIYTELDGINKVGLVKGLAHITGGGLAENIPRMLPDHLVPQLGYNYTLWPDVFIALLEAGNLSVSEMERTFNCGIGMVAVVGIDNANIAVELLNARKLGYVVTK